MKTIEKERVVTTKYEIYVAEDGTEFTDKDECKKYDESARGIVSARYAKMLISEESFCSIFGCGSDDDSIDVVRVCSQSDIDTLARMHALTPYCGEWRSRDTAMAERALKEEDVLLIGRGYEGDCFYLIGTKKQVFEDIERNIAHALNEKIETDREKAQE